MDFIVFGVIFFLITNLIWNITFWAFWTTYSPALFFVLILLVALTLAFWQAIKAVIYYDILIRREGLGLEITRDS